jgi:sialate O-acetylesterase
MVSTTKFDTSSSKRVPRWYETAYKPKGWKAINVPGYWEDQGIKNLDGIVWYRKIVHLSKSHLNQSAKLWLGRIVDADEVYINGEKIGGFGYMYPQRRYKVSENILKEGENTIVVKVTNHFGKGGFVPDKPYALIISKDTIDLKGEWHYKVGKVFEPKKPTGLPMIALHNQPTALYNAMVHPLINYPIKGVLWYQGESNIGNAAQYDQLLEALITDWRSRWQNPTLPVIFAQLPGFMEYNYLPSESGWALHREATLKATKIPNTAMTVNIDLGEWNDIHPDNKKDVGERMALAAYNLIYGENTVSSGPIYKSHQMKNHQIIIGFDHIGSGLSTTDGESPQEFAIADETKKFRWAKTKIEGNTIVVWHDEIQNPKYVRYAWADNPVNPNLANKEGLPASPFRTDP